jgi:hypothetical protein
LLALALSLAGCSLSDDDPELSRGVSRSLRADLKQVEEGVRAGDCTRAQEAVLRLQAQIDELDADVSAKLRRALADSADRLNVLVRDQCRPAVEAAPAVTPEATQETTQDEQSKKEKKSKPGKDKPGKDKPDATQPEEVPPGQDEGDGTTPPGQQGGDGESPGGDTGGASPDG